MWDRGRLEQALDMMERSFEILSQEEPDEDLASLAAQVGRLKFFAGDTQTAFERIEFALHLAEAFAVPEVLSQALNTKAIIFTTFGRKNEALVLLKYALDVALDHDKPSAALRAYYNLADTLGRADRYEEAAKAVRDGLAQARRIGNRWWELQLLGQPYPFFALGEWDEVLALSSELPEEEWLNARGAYMGVLGCGAALQVQRGRLDDADRIVKTFGPFAESADAQERAIYASANARLLLTQGHAAEALTAAEEGFAGRESMGVNAEYVKESFVVAVEAAFELGQVEKVEELLGVVEGLPPGARPQFLLAQASRFRARLGSERAEDLFKGAAGLFRELAVPFYLTVTELEHAEWLSGQGRTEEAEALLTEAREIFERLEAAPWLARGAGMAVTA
jgi:tetratricopeptide (TPR) repeat protein